MKKRYKGFCPPFIAIGLALLLMTLSSLWAIAYAADNVIPGSETAPPGGSTTIYMGGDTVTGGSDIVTGSSTDPDITPVEDPSVVSPDLGPAPGDIVVGGSEYPTGTQPDTPTTGVGGTEVTVPDDVTPEEPTVEPDPVGKYPSKLDTTGVTVTSPSLDALLEDGADLEALLYPSGLKLPTKYMDLIMFAPVTYSAPVTSEVAYFLKTAAPTADGTYTFAEYKAAEVYLALCRMTQEEYNTTATSNSVVSLDANTTVNWTQNITNATVADTSRLTMLISNYKDILEKYAEGSTITQHRQYNDFIADHKGVRYSCGNLDELTNLVTGTSVRDADLSSYILGLYSWWDYVGVTQNLTSALLTYSSFYNEFAYNNINYNKGAPIQTTVSTGDGEQSTTPGTTVTTPELSGDGQSSGSETIVSGTDLTGGQSTTVSGSSGTENWVSPSAGSDTPVSSVGSTSAADTSVLPDGSTGLREVGSIAALVFVSVAVIGLLIIHISRRGRLF